MKKFIFIICVSILTVLLVNPGNGEKVLRLRVIANSDSVSDQGDKMRVVEEVDRILDSCSFESVDEAEAWIVDNMDKIEDACADVWCGDFTSELRRETYDDGEYKSLVITLGEGTGHNFWGTLFPDISSRMAGVRSSKIKPFKVISKNGELFEVRFFVLEKILNIF